MGKATEVALTHRSPASRVQRRNGATVLFTAPPLSHTLEVASRSCVGWVFLFSRLWKVIVGMIHSPNSTWRQLLFFHQGWSRVPVAVL